MFVILDCTTKSLVLSDNNADEVLKFNTQIEAYEYGNNNLQKSLFVVVGLTSEQASYL